MTDYKYDRLTCILIESIIVDFWWTFLVLTFTFVFYRITDTIKHDIMKNNIPHFLHCTINCLSHLVHYIMERSPAVFSFHPICSPQIDLSTPSNQCGINCMKSHLHTYTSPSPTQPHTTSTCISSPTPDPWKTHKAHTDEVVPIDPRVVSSSILQPLANIQYNIPPISCIILNISRYSKNSICMVSA